MRISKLLKKICGLDRDPAMIRPTYTTSWDSPVPPVSSFLTIGTR